MNSFSFYLEPSSLCLIVALGYPNDAFISHKRVDPSSVNIHHHGLHTIYLMTRQ